MPQKVPKMSTVSHDQAERWWRHWLVAAVAVEWSSFLHSANSLCVSSARCHSNKTSQVRVLHRFRWKCNCSCVLSVKIIWLCFFCGHSVYLSHTLSEIFSIKYWQDLEIWVRVVQGNWKWRRLIDLIWLAIATISMALVRAGNDVLCGVPTDWYLTF